MTQPQRRDRKDARPDVTPGIEPLTDEYVRVTALLLANEKRAQKRVQVYVATIIVACGVMTWTVVRNPSHPLAAAIRASWLPLSLALAALLVFGVSTLLRVVERHLATDRYQSALSTLRRQLGSLDLTGGPAVHLHGGAQGKAPQPDQPVQAGSLDLIILLNSVVLAVLAWTVTATFLGSAARVGMSVLVTALGLPCQLLWVTRCYARQVRTGMIGK